MRLRERGAVSVPRSRTEGRLVILVLSGDEDPHADAVERELGLVGAAVVRFDPARYPVDATLTVRVDPVAGAVAVLRDGDTDIAMDDVDAVWVRRPGRPRAPAPLVGTAIGDQIEVETREVLVDLWHVIDVRFVPARPAQVQLASYKIRQLVLAAQLGFEIPPTVVTSDPDAFLDHYAATAGRMITKRAVSLPRVVTVAGEEVGRTTLVVRPRDLAEVDAVRLSPITAQAMVDKDVEVRVTVVGDKVFAAAIHSQDTHHTRVDFRNYDTSHTRLDIWPMPQADQDRCVALTRALGLCYSTIDLIITPDGRTVFLELNPSGQYLWVEFATGMPITRAIALLLAGKAQP
jgi:hypothetical protein